MGKIINKLLKKLLEKSKKVITINLDCITLFCGNLESEKTIYKISKSEHLVELRQQERAYRNSHDKYSVLFEMCRLTLILALPRHLGSLSVVTLAPFIYLSILYMFRFRLGWFFENACYWLKRRRFVRLFSATTTSSRQRPIDRER